VKNTIAASSTSASSEAIKSARDLTKVAYSDWKRAGDYSVSSPSTPSAWSAHMTPGGDKNGADITMALDALEMAFTHDHINAFVIVGGDSDFHLAGREAEQYGLRSCGRLDASSPASRCRRNCHEFIGTRTSSAAAAA